jgi:predicted O-methyltransferase YrrM
VATIDEAVEAAAQIDGWMSIDELRWLGEQAALCEVAVEIGSWCGRSTKALAMMVQDFIFAIDTFEGSAEHVEGQGTRILSDADIYRRFLTNLAPEIAEHKVVVLPMESTEAALRVRESAATIDMLFIDGSHLYEAVRNDIASFLPFVRSGGVVCGHDFWSEDVRRAVAELLPDARPMVDFIWACTVP